MINSSELKIGNLIQWNEEVPAIVAVTGIHKDSIDFDGQYKGLMSVERFNPIPLTDDWISKLGFENSEKEFGIGFYHPNTMLFELYRKNKEFGYYYSVRHSNSMVYVLSEHLKYVHQLQNLYFCLTGQELIIK